MDDIEITKKEIEDKLFNFIEENFGKKRTECFNEVVNFVEDKIIPTLINTDEDLEIENNELEDRVMELENAFDTLKGDCCDRLEEIESDLENTIENDELDSVLDELKKLKESIKHHIWVVSNADNF
jgi:predicted RNase H-like nuclease (RuvC/YqgF family)